MSTQPTSWLPTQRFFSWQLFVLLAIYGLGFQLVLLVSEWLNNPEHTFSWARFIRNFSINYPNLVFACLVNFQIITKLNQFFPWETKSTRMLRISIELVACVLSVSLQVVLVNWLIAVLSGLPVDFSHFLYSAITGVIINLILIITMEFYFQFKRQYETALDNEWLKKENLQFRYSLLKNQINPHFLFNSLNSLSSLISIDEDRAKESVRKLAQVYRYVLEHGEKQLVTLQEEVCFIDNYIYMLKIRFQEDLIIDLAIEDNTLRKKIVPMTLQILLENAVKHNSIEENQPFVITIQAQNDMLTVHNPMNPRQQAHPKGIGLHNLKQKYKFHNSDIAIHAEADCFTVSIPLL